MTLKWICLIVAVTSQFNEAGLSLTTVEVADYASCQRVGRAAVAAYRAVGGFNNRLRYSCAEVRK